MNHLATNELLAFRHFIDEKLHSGGSQLLPEEVLDEWRETHLGPDEIDEAEVAAIQEALDDMAIGDRGRDAQEALADLRARLKL